MKGRELFLRAKRAFSILEKEREICDSMSEWCLFVCLFLDLLWLRRVDERVGEGFWRESSAGIERVVGFEYLTTWACRVSWARVGVASDGKRKGLDAWEF